MSTHLREEDGFTLVELMVAMVIGLIVAGIASSTTIVALKTQRSQAQHLEGLNTAKLALERVTRELRAAEPLAAPAADAVQTTISRGGAQTVFSFRVEATGSGRGRLRMCAAPLASCTSGVGRVLVTDVLTGTGNETFAYFGSTDPATPLTGGFSAAEVKQVRVRLRIELSDPTRTVDLVDTVTVRNWSGA